MEQVDFKNDRSAAMSEYARVWGSPGEGARTAGMLRMFWPVLVLTLLTGYVLGVALPPLDQVPMVISGLALLLLAAGLAWVVKRCQKGYAKFLKGARGEELVARILGFLPANYYVFHSLQLERSTGRGAGDFDHVVVGPNGVFVVETKNWSGDIDVMDGKVFVDGEPASFSPVEQAREGGEMLADWVQDQEKVTPDVHSIVCFVSSSLPNGPKEVDGVTICDGMTLENVLMTGARSGVGLDGVLTRTVNALQLQMKPEE